MNSCFEGLDRRMGLNRVREFIPKAVKKIEVLDGGRKEDLVNSCIECLDGRMGLKRVREFVPKAAKKRNERVKLSSDS